MNLTKTRTIKITLFAATFFFAAVRAHAERASFNLPVEAHWGSTILEPGEYIIDVPLATSWPQLISLTRNGKLVRLQAMTEATETKSKGSYLQLVTVGDTYFVREYNSGSAGKLFTFNVPKGATYKLTNTLPANTRAEGAVPAIR